MPSASAVKAPRAPLDQHPRPLQTPWLCKTPEAEAEADPAMAAMTAMNSGPLHQTITRPPNVSAALHSRIGESAAQYVLHQVWTETPGNSGIVPHQ